MSNKEDELRTFLIETIQQRNELIEILANWCAMLELERQGIKQGVYNKDNVLYSAIKLEKLNSDKVGKIRTILNQKILEKSSELRRSMYEQSK